VSLLWTPGAALDEASLTGEGMPVSLENYVSHDAAAADGVQGDERTHPSVCDNPDDAQASYVRKD
jgi:hypothetical protein